MISLQYLPLSVRVRAWNLSCFSSEELETFIQDDLQTVFSKVSAKERKTVLDTSDSKNFLRTMKLSLIQYGKIGIIASSGEGKSFIKEMFREFEIENLKMLVQMITSKNFRNTFYPEELTPSLTISKLSEIRTFNELSHMLEGTDYYPFCLSLQKVEQEKNVLYWEVMLDNFYANRILMVSKRLDMNSRKAVKKLLLLPLQFERLISLYRYRFHYNVEPAEALQYVPNSTHLMTDEEWFKFVSAPSNSEFFHYLVEHGFISEDIPNNASDIRTFFRRKVERYCRQSLHSNLTDISSFLAFIQLKRIQYQKISTIIEAKSLKVSKSDIMQFL